MESISNSDRPVLSLLRLRVRAFLLCIFASFWIAFGLAYFNLGLSLEEVLGSLHLTGLLGASLGFCGVALIYNYKTKDWQFSSLLLFVSLGMFAAWYLTRLPA